MTDTTVPTTTVAPVAANTTVSTNTTTDSTPTPPTLPIVPENSVTFPKLPKVWWVAVYTAIEVVTAGFFFWLNSSYGKGKSYQPYFSSLAWAIQINSWPSVAAGLYLLAHLHDTQAW